MRQAGVELQSQDGQGLKNLEPSLLNTVDKDRGSHDQVFIFQSLFLEVGFEMIEDLGRMALDVEGITSGKKVQYVLERKKKGMREMPTIQRLDFVDLGDWYFEPGFLKSKFKCCWQK